MGTDDTRSLPERLKQLRARLGLSQVKLAALLGVSSLSIIRWEHGRISSAMRRPPSRRCSAASARPTRNAGRSDASGPRSVCAWFLCLCRNRDPTCVERIPPIGGSTRIKAPRA
ncbi:MAG: helix-turn-helix transcriptional regulator [Dehalococcoidia bacterium]